MTLGIVIIVALTAAKPTPSPSPAPTPTPSPPPASSGGWSIVSSPNPDPSNNRLEGVAVVTSADAWAVGSAGSNALTEHWDGSHWSVVPTPMAPGASQEGLVSAAAVAGNDVWAVGWSSNTYGWSTLSMHWNGSQWTIVPTPNAPVGPTGPALNSVVAVASNDVWAVGGSYKALGNYPGKALLEHWDGVGWSIVQPPAGTGSWSSSSRFGAAAVSSNDVWAVGDYDSFNWNGNAWNVVFGAQSVVAASAAGATSIWAVGSYTSYDGYTYSGPFTLAYRWDGTAWRYSQSLSPTGDDTFAGVAAISSTDVWAVGSSQGFTLAEHWNGSSWSVVGTPNASPNSDRLDAVAANASNNVWAVGSYLTSGGLRLTLIEHFTG